MNCTLSETIYDESGRVVGTITQYIDTFLAVDATGKPVRETDNFEDALVQLLALDFND
jgi:hypothetical protein